jgi:membrane-associated PAP2 superfamily phosphatase
MRSDIAGVRLERRLNRRFWITHALLPALFATLGLLWIYSANIDLRIAHAQFYSVAHRAWLGEHAWWATLVHEGGRALVVAVALSALLVFFGTQLFPSLLPLARDAAFIATAVALSTAVIALLKLITNVDCPWDLTEFGGAHLYASPFGHRDPGMPRAECFPASHSGAGFALMCFYFVLRERAPRAASIALAGALLTGALFAYAQEARGAHFLSHDFTSLFLVWYVQLALYVSFKRRPPETATAS